MKQVVSSLVYNTCILKIFYSKQQMTSVNHIFQCYIVVKNILHFGILTIIHFEIGYSSDICLLRTIHSTCQFQNEFTGVCFSFRICGLKKKL